MLFKTIENSALLAEPVSNFSSHAEVIEKVKELSDSYGLPKTGKKSLIVVSGFGSALYDQEKDISFASVNASSNVLYVKLVYVPKFVKRIVRRALPEGIDQDIGLVNIKFTNVTDVKAFYESMINESRVFVAENIIEILTMKTKDTIYFLPALSIVLSPEFTSTNKLRVSGRLVFTNEEWYKNDGDQRRRPRNVMLLASKNLKKADADGNIQTRFLYVYYQRPLKKFDLSRFE